MLDGEDLPSVVAGEAVVDGVAICTDEGVVGSWVRAFLDGDIQVFEGSVRLSIVDDGVGGGTNGGIFSEGKYVVRRRFDTTSQWEGSSLGEAHSTAAVVSVTSR